MSTNTHKLSIDNIVGVETITDEAASVCSGGARPPLGERDIVLYKNNDSPYPRLSYFNTEKGFVRDLRDATGGAEPGEYWRETSYVVINKGTWNFRLTTDDRPDVPNSITLGPGKYDLATFRGGKFNDTFRTANRIR